LLGDFDVWDELSDELFDELCDEFSDVVDEGVSMPLEEGGASA